MGDQRVRNDHGRFTPRGGGKGRKGKDRKTGRQFTVMLSSHRGPRVRRGRAVMKKKKGRR